MSEKAKANRKGNGHERTAGDETPVGAKTTNDRPMDDMAILHSGARLAAKLKARIIVNDDEFNHAGEMSVDDRHLYHEALEAVFPSNIAISSGEAEVFAAQPGLRYKKVVLFLVVLTVFAGAVYLWIHGFLG